MKRTYLCAMLVSLLVASSYAGIPIAANQPSSLCLRSWLLCGPFPNPKEPYDKQDKQNSGFYQDYLKAHGGETALEIQAGQTEPFENASIPWIAYESEADSIYLDKVISQDPYVLAYAYCEIRSDKETPCLFAAGSNDGARVWLNGEEILDVPERRGLQADDNLIPVVLRQGRNTLLLKIAETENLWGFTCRFLPFSVDSQGAEQPLFAVKNTREGKAIVKYTGSKSLIGKIMKSVRWDVYASPGAEQPLSSQTWNGDVETEISVDTASYREYCLKIKVEWINGAQQTIVLPFTAGKRIEYTLFQRGLTDYRIVLGDNASESEKWAAQELRHWLKEICGADFLICSDSEAQSPKEIIVGFNKHSLALLGENERTEPKESDESFAIRNAGPSILIWGGKARGTMYGVFTFLENEFGCRWYTPRVTSIPAKDSYIFTALNHSESPGIRVRNDFYFEAFDPIWAARNKVNGAMSYREQPGGLECYWSVHTFFPLVPPEEFYEKHPEYYSLIDGKRVYEYAQLCLTNPDVLRIVTERILDTIRKNPQYLIYCVSQNDWRNPCQCDACQAIAKREESESGPVVWFVNQVAEAVEKEFPDKFIGTLAYQYTRKPCKTLKPRDNVVIRLCSIECCFAHDFEHCPQNESFVEDIQGWANIAPHIYIWDYVVNFSHYIMPYPNFRVLQPNIQYFRDHNSIGIMEQAAYQGRGGEFAELRAYLISKLLWNPNCDVEPVINDFMYGYYGRSGQYVRQYFDLLHNRLTPDTHIHLGLSPEDRLFSDEFVEQSLAIFAQAEKVAETPEIRNRVEMTSLPVLYLKCKRDPQKAVNDGNYKRFCEIAEREGVTYYAESGKEHREAFHTAMEKYEGND